MTERSQNEMSLSGGSLSALIEAVLGKDASFRFQAKGFSMSPFIMDKDIITISPISENMIQVGDIVAAINPFNNKLLVHRVVSQKGESYLIKGDNCSHVDGNFIRKDILGIVTLVERRNKKVWHGSGILKILIAFFSRWKILNKIILPTLRKIKQTIPM